MRVVCCVHGCLSRGDCGQWAAGGVDMASVDDMFDLCHPSRADNTTEVSNYVYINGKMCDVCVCVACMHSSKIETYRTTILFPMAVAVLPAANDRDQPVAERFSSVDKCIQSLGKMNRCGSACCRQKYDGDYNSLAEAYCI